MKKYLSVLFLVVFIVPSVVFASWWNPFSWNIFNKIFHKEEKVETQELNLNEDKEVQSFSNINKKTSEEKINELQKQLDELKNNQLVKPTTVVKNVINTKTESVNNKKNDEENFNTALIDYRKSGLEIYKTIMSSIDDFTSIMDERINKNNKAISNIQYPNGVYHNPDKMDLALINLHKSDIDFVNKTKNNFIYYKNSIQKVIDLSNSDFNKWSVSNISREDFLAKTTEFKKTDEAVDKIKTKVFEDIKVYRDYVEDTDSYYQKIYGVGGLLDSYIQSLQNQIDNIESNNYYSPLPPLEIPQTTRCTINYYGSNASVSCYSN